MMRTVLCCALAVMIGAPCRAQQTASTPETLIKLSVTPAPEPAPALRYLLLPDLKEMNPGNPIHGYLKCFMEQHKFFFDKEAFDRREKLLSMPLKELPITRARGLRPDCALAGGLGRPIRSTGLADSVEDQV